jgi:tRNA pseudouridine65 synthase
MRLLHVDDVLAAFDKPSGMLVHNGWARAPVVAVGEARRFVGKFVHPVHRLDRGASGVLLFALDKPTAAALHASFEDGRVDKRYLALVRGVAPDEGVIDHPIPRREDGPRVAAVTSFKRIGVSPAERLSLVEARPRTGRLHQVRRHLKHIDHPIIGDANYGKGELNRDLAARYGLNRLALHAASLELDHPATGERLRIDSPLPDDLRGPLVRMGFKV